MRKSRLSKAARSVKENSILHLSGLMIIGQNVYNKVESQIKLDLIGQTCAKLAGKINARLVIALETHLIAEEGEGSIDLSKHDDIIYQYICMKKNKSLKFTLLCIDLQFDLHINIQEKQLKCHKNKFYR